MNEKNDCSLDLESQTQYKIDEHVYSLEDIISMDEAAEEGTSRGFLLESNYDQNKGHISKDEFSCDKQEYEQNNFEDEHQNESSLNDDRQGIQIEIEEDDNIGIPMQTEYTYDDNLNSQQDNYENQVEETNYSFERVEQIALNKMTNLKTLLLLNLCGTLLGVLNQSQLLPYIALFFITLLVIGIMLVQSIKTKERSGLNNSITKAKIFRIFNWSCLGLYFLMALLRYLGKIESISPWTIPGCLSIFLESFYMSSNFTSGEKGFEISVKYAIWVQLFLIALKVDGATIPWAFALFVLISFGCLSLVIAIILLVISVSAIMGVPCYNVTGKTAILGSGWYLFISISNVLWGLITLKAKGLLTSQESSESIFGLFLFGMIYSASLLIYTRKFYNTLLLFLKFEAFYDLQEIGQLNNFNCDTLQTDEPFRYNYLARITSTYFSTIQRSFQIKDKVVLSRWNRDIKRAKFYKFFPLKKAKFFSKSLKGSPCRIAEKKVAQSANLLTNPISLYISGKSQSQVKEEEMYSPSLELGNHKIVYSFDDKDVLKKVKRPGDEENEEEKELCMVCYETEADAVIMDCGHGGVCYSCAIKGWENSDKCHMCRMDIKTILKVKNLPAFQLVKVLDEIEKIVEREDIIA